MVVVTLMKDAGEMGLLRFLSKEAFGFLVSFIFLVLFF